MAAPLDLTALLGNLAAAQQPQQPQPDPQMLPNGGLPGGEDPGVLGTVLARLRTNAPAIRRGITAGGYRPPAPSRGGAIAQGAMQGMEGYERAKQEEAAAKRLQDLFLYNQAKDARDFAYKVQKDNADRTSTAEWRKTWATGQRGKAMDPLAREEKINKILSEHPAQKALDSDNEENIPSRKLPPERRAELQATLEAERARLRKLAGGDEGESEAAPPPASVPSRPTVAPEAPESAAPAMPSAARPADVPTPTPRPQSGPPVGMPSKIINRSTGEVREWDPAAGDYVSVRPDLPSLGSPM